MGKNKRLKKRILSLEAQIKQHQEKQRKIKAGDAPWIEQYWQKETKLYQEQAREAQRKLPGRAKQNHKTKT